MHMLKMKYKHFLIAGILIILAATAYTIDYYSDVSHYNCSIMLRNDDGSVSNCSGKLVCGADIEESYGYIPNMTGALIVPLSGL